MIFWTQSSLVGTILVSPAALVNPTWHAAADAGQ